MLAAERHVGPEEAAQRRGEEGGDGEKRKGKALTGAPCQGGCRCTGLCRSCVPARALSASRQEKRRRMMEEDEARRERHKKKKQRAEQRVGATNVNKKEEKADANAQLVALAVVVVDDLLVTRHGRVRVHAA
eukprot:2505377-Rhodomonas_salina.4